SDLVHRACFLLSARVLNLALVGVLGGLLNIARAFLQLALDLLGSPFDLLTRASRRFPHFTLYFACNILRCALNLIAVHENLRSRPGLASGTIKLRFLIKWNDSEPDSAVSGTPKSHR